MTAWQTFVLGLCEHLAWPSLVGGCIFMFRKDVRKLLSRLTKLPGGAELNPETVEEQKEAKKEFNIILKNRGQTKEDTKETQVPARHREKKQ